jgi:hypothetical protein
MTETSRERLVKLADGTRTPAELAALLGLSVARVHQIIGKLRDGGVEVPVRKTGARNGMASPRSPEVRARISKAVRESPGTQALLRQMRERYRTFAERMRPVMAELAGLSATAAAHELNARKIATAAGGKWYPATVIRLRERINEGGGSS